MSFVPVAAAVPRRFHGRLIKEKLPISETTFKYRLRHVVLKSIRQKSSFVPVSRHVQKFNGS